MSSPQATKPRIIVLPRRMENPDRTVASVPDTSVTRPTVARHDPASEGRRRAPFRDSGSSLRAIAELYDDPPAERAHERVNVSPSIVVMYRCLPVCGSAPQAPPRRGRMRDLSLGGTRFTGKLDRALVPQDLLSRRWFVEMQMFLPYVDLPVTVRGQVARMRPHAERPHEFEFGVKFRAVPDETESAIYRFLIATRFDRLRNSKA